MLARSPRTRVRVASLDLGLSDPCHRRTTSPATGQPGSGKSLTERTGPELPPAGLLSPDLIWSQDPVTLSIHAAAVLAPCGDPVGAQPRGDCFVQSDPHNGASATTPQVVETLVRTGRRGDAQLQPVSTLDYAEVVGVQPGAGPGAAQEPLVALQATLTVRLTLAPLHPTTG